jgi:hypothetical protein
MSDRAIAEEVGVEHHMVGRVRGAMGQSPTKPQQPKTPKVSKPKIPNIDATTTINGVTDECRGLPACAHANDPQEPPLLEPRCPRLDG